MPQNSLVYEIYNIHKFQNTNKMESSFPDQQTMPLNFVLTINFKMPTYVGILKILMRTNVMLNGIEHDKKLYNVGARFLSGTLLAGVPFSSSSRQETPQSDVHA